MRHLVFGLVMALLLSSSAISAGPSANAFITNSGNFTVSVFDTANPSGVSSVSVGVSTHGVAMDPRGVRAYVVGANLTSGKVYAIKTDSKTVVGTATVGKSTFGIAVSPDGKRLFVTHRVQVTSTMAVGAITAIDVGSEGVLSAGPTVTVGGAATGVAVSPSGDRVYVANTTRRVTVIDPALIGVTGANPILSNVFVAGAVVGVAVSPDGTRLYATDAANSKLWVIEVSLIGTLADPVVASVNVGVGPFGVAVSPNGKRIVVANMGSNNATVIDSALIGSGANAVVATTGVGSGPHGVAFTSDGAKAYVVNRFNDSISVLDGTSGALMSTVQMPASSFPVGFGTFLTPFQLITVIIDVVPKSINLKAQGTLPVVIFGSESFDIYSVDLSSVRLSGWAVKQKPNGELMAQYGDFNCDGLEDIKVHIDMGGVQEALVSSGDATVILQGQANGVAFQGSDSVRILH